MNKALWIMAGLWPFAASAQIELVPEVTPQAVFASRPQTIRVTLRNPGDKTMLRDVELRLFQLSSASAVPVGSAKPWKKIEMLPQQTVLETLALEFPSVRAATRFRVEFAGIGRTEVVVYPGELLKRLKTLAGDQPLGVVDPDGQLKPVLKQAGVEFADFEIEPADSRLAIVWSGASSLPETVTTRVKAGMAVVWIRPASVATTYAVRLDTGVVVVVPVSSVRGLADSPLPQLDLIRAAELALEPEALRLPSDNQPQ